jgi:hypothetical protein
MKPKIDCVGGTKDETKGLTFEGVFHRLLSLIVSYAASN